MALSASLLLLSCSGGNASSSQISQSPSSSAEVSSSQESSSTSSSSEASSESSSEEIVGDEHFALSSDKAYFTLINCPDAFASDYFVPSEYKGLPVKAIANTAFKGAL